MIALEKGQTAAPSQCGSCHFFRRRDQFGESYGICSIKLPGWVAMKEYSGERDSWCNERTVIDFSGCDLWRPKLNDTGQPETFSMVATWRAGEPPGWNR